MTLLEISKVALEMGITLLSNGAETYRVEESMRRVCKALGAKEAEVFVVPSTIILTLIGDEEVPLTQTRRIRAHTIDLHKVQEMNQLSRDICADQRNHASLMSEIDRINKFPSFPFYFHLLAVALVSQMFTLLSGGNFGDSCISFVIGLLLKLLLNTMSRLEANSFFVSTIGGLMIATIAVTTFGLGWTHNMNAIIIGCIMNLVPGLTITNSIRDIIAGDYLSGLTKSAEALLVGATIAMGVALPLTFLRVLFG